MVRVTVFQNQVPASDRRRGDEGTRFNTIGNNGVLGAMQSVASLARAVGPSLAAFLIYSAVAHVGFDGRPQNMSDSSIFRTFWIAAAIQFVAFLIAVYFARRYGEKYATGGIAEAA